MKKQKPFEPTIFKTRAWKQLSKELGKPPMFRIRATNMRDKEEAKQAKLMEKLINYHYEKNIDGVTTKWIELQKLLAKYVFEEQVYGIKVRWDRVKKEIDKTISNLPND